MDNAPIQPSAECDVVGLHCDIRNSWCSSRILSQAWRYASCTPILLHSLASSLRSSSWLLFVPNSSISAEPSHALPCSCRYQLELLFELFSRPQPETRLPFEEFPRLFLQATKLFLFCTTSSLQTPRMSISRVVVASSWFVWLIVIKLHGNPFQSQRIHRPDGQHCLSEVILVQAIFSQALFGAVKTFVIACVSHVCMVSSHFVRLLCSGFLHAFLYL